MANLTEAVVAEWLRRLTRNQIPFGSVGSSPTDCEFFFDGLTTVIHKLLTVASHLYSTGRMNNFLMIIRLNRNYAEQQISI